MSPVGRRGRPGLSEDGIVDAGLKLLRADGLAAVTMRRVATELGVGPASLYVHISGRDELCLAMLERVVGTVPLPAPDRRHWRRQVHELLGGLRQALGAHPGLAAIAVARSPADERSLLLTENLLGLLRCGGVGGQDAAWAADALPLLTTASALAAGPADEEPDAAGGRADGSAGGTDSSPGDGDAFVALPPERFPTITALADELTTGSAAERLHFAVDALLDGLVARSIDR